MKSEQTCLPVPWSEEEEYLAAFSNQPIILFLLPN
jgi:hypothetical protein